MRLGRVSLSHCHRMPRIAAVSSYNLLIGLFWSIQGACQAVLGEALLGLCFTTTVHFARICVDAKPCALVGIHARAGMLLLQQELCLWRSTIAIRLVQETTTAH